MTPSAPEPSVSPRLLTRCRACYAEPTDWREVLRMDPMPLAGQFCTTADEARTATKYPLTWIQCLRCSLVQVLEDIDDDVLFRQYNYASSTMGGLVRHFEHYAAALRARFGSNRSVSLLEIGCNDGVLLKALPSNWRLVGVDPSDVAFRGASPQYKLVNLPFTEKLAADIDGSGSFDVVTASNCMAHIHDLRDVFLGVRRVLREGGEFFIEVHDLDATRRGQWDTIYHEHKAEWSERSLVHCLSSLGFDLLSLDRLPLHGGLMRACFRKSNGVAGSPSRPAQFESFEQLQVAYRERRTTDLYRKLRADADAGLSISAYGASGRANVWLNQLPELAFRYVVDESPLRYGKWIPATTVPIVPRSHLVEEPTDVCVITAWNYAADIQAKNSSFQGTWRQTFYD